MRIEVRERGVDAHEAVRNYVGLRLMSVLDYRVRRVESVIVSVTDAARTVEGAQTRCRMLAQLVPSGEVRVEEVDSRLHDAIDRAAERLSVAVDEASRGRSALPLRGPARSCSVVPSRRDERVSASSAPMGRMRIHVQSRALEHTEALHGYVQRRLLFALSRFGARVQSVRVRLDDLNGPRGGIDKRCQIDAHLGPWGDVRIEQSAGEVHAAIDRAADRLQHAVAREMERRRQTQVVPLTRPGKENLR